MIISRDGWKWTLMAFMETHSPVASETSTPQRDQNL